MRLKSQAVCVALVASLGACADLDLAASNLSASRFVEILREQSSPAAAAVDAGDESAEGAAALAVSDETVPQVAASGAGPRPVLRPSRDPDAPVATLSTVNAFVSGCVRQLPDPAKTVAEFSLLGFTRSQNSPRRFSRGAMIAGVVTLQEESRYVCYAGAPVRDFNEFVEGIDRGVRRATALPVERSEERGRNAWRLQLENGGVAVISIDRKRREDGIVFSLAKLAYDADGA